MDAFAEFRRAQARMLERFGVPARSTFIDVRAVQGRTHVLSVGEGPPVVLVPGFADPAAMWAPLMAELAGFTLHAVDRPCFGLTGCAPHTTASLRPMAVDFLDHVLSALDLPQAAFIGNSMGALWSMWLAIERPERVAALSIVGCPALVLGTSAPLPMRLLGVHGLGRAIMRAAPPSPEQVRRFAKLVGEDFTHQPEVVDLLVSVQRTPGTPQAMRELLRASVGVLGPRSQLVLREMDLERIACPVQLVWGGHDAFGSPAVARRTAMAIPDARLHFIDDAGHLPWIRFAPQVGVLVRDFLHALEQPAAHEHR